MAFPVARPPMDLTAVDGIELDIHDRGSGEPVVFVHGGSTDECYAVIQEPALAERFRVIHYQRRGWGRSSHDGLPLSIQQQSADCRAVMLHSGIDRAHLVGLSYGGAILLQFALDYPDAVHSLALVEPGLPGELEDPELGTAFEEAIALYAAGDKEGTVRTAFGAICGESFEATFDQTLPAGWFERWVADVDTLFLHDLPALESWEFTADDAARIDAPVLNMTGSDSKFQGAYETIQSWIPHAEPVMVGGATHCIFEMAPQGAAERLAKFFSHHPFQR